MSSSNRHPFVLLGAAASLITVLSFLGITGWSKDSDADRPVDSAGAQTAGPGGVPATYRTTTRAAVRTTRTTPAVTTPASAICTFADELAEGQAAETVILSFGSKSYRMSLGADRSRQQLRIRFTVAGSHRYTVATSTLHTDGTIRDGAGSGSVTCTGGEEYTLAGDYTADPAVIVLELS
jgi:hypothetical protein